MSKQTNEKIDKLANSKAKQGKILKKKKKGFKPISPF